MLKALQALLGTKPAFSLGIDGVDALRVVAFEAREGISDLYEVRIDAAGGELALDSVVGKDAYLRIEGLEAPRYFHGIVSEIEHIGHSKRFALYRLTLVPRLWRLTLRQGCRIHQHKATPDILREVFKAAGLPKGEIRFDLSAEYEERNYCVQYRESDFAFISRLMEEDGIFYFFEHTDEGATLVLADSPGAHPPIAGTPALEAMASERFHEGECVHDVHAAQSLRSGRVTLRDINLHEPEESLEVSVAGDRDDDLEIYDYPGEYQVLGSGGPAQGESLAQIRLEQATSLQRRLSGESNSPRLTAGHVFSITRARLSEINVEQVLASVVHRGQQPQVLQQHVEGSLAYENRFIAFDKKVRFRSPRRTPRPFVRGLQSATVVGPASEEIHTDAEGRVLVQFHWDREGQRDENSSCWVRVSQAWAGASWGALFLPRIGHEVLVDFIEGDPDRPVITGRIYTGGNMPPYPLPDEKTKSTIKSESSPGGRGFNELRFEDSKGSEEIFIHAEKDLNEVVKNNNSRSVGGSQSFSVSGSQSFTVTGDRSLTVTEGDESTTVAAGKSTTQVQADRDVTVVAGNSTLTVAAGTHTATVNKQVTVESKTEGIDLLAPKKVSVTSTANDLELVGKNNAVLSAATKALKLQAKQDVVLSSETTNVSIGAPTEVSLSTPQAIKINGKTIEIGGTEKITLSVGATSITIGPSGISISGPKITSSAIGIHEISGALIKIN